MRKSKESIIDIINHGAGVTVDGGYYGIDTIREFAKYAKARQVRLVVVNADRFSVESLKDIAQWAGGYVHFELKD